MVEGVAACDEVVIWNCHYREKLVACINFREGNGIQHFQLGNMLDDKLVPHFDARFGVHILDLLVLGKLVCEVPLLLKILCDRNLLEMVRLALEVMVMIRLKLTTLVIMESLVVTVEMMEETTKPFFQFCLSLLVLLISFPVLLIIHRVG